MDNTWINVLLFGFWMFCVGVWAGCALEASRWRKNAKLDQGIESKGVIYSVLKREY